MLLKYTGGSPVELAFTVNGREYVQKPGEDLTVDDRDADYFIGLGAWEVKSAVQTKGSRPSPSSDTPAG